MAYFVTGATGFIGRFLVSNLLKRRGMVHVLVRKGSEKKLDDIATSMGWDRKRIVVVTGDLSKPKLGLAPAKIKALARLKASPASAGSSGGGWRKARTVKAAP